jgi:DNA-binding NarL/FixJ family response regulator
LPLGIERHKQLRCLVCDGPALLAWFGAFIPERVEQRQFELLRRLVRPLRQRLALEERLREGSHLRAALEAALEHVSAPAFVLGERGNPREANAAGRALLDGTSRSETLAALRDAALGRTRRAAYELTPLRHGDRTVGWLALVAASEPGAGSHRRLKAARHARRWHLSPRQTEVLQLLVDGASNLRIACEFGISERTVEDHVSAILTKAQVGTRAALIAEMIG